LAGWVAAPLDACGHCTSLLAYFVLTIIMVWIAIAVQVVLKGPSIRHRKTSGEQPFTSLQQQQQQQQQQQFGPRSQGTLSEQQYGSPPTTASTVALGMQGTPMPPGTQGSANAYAQGSADQPMSATYAGGMQQQQHQQHQQGGGSRPSTNGSSCSASRSNSGSRRSSRRSSKGGYPEVNPGAGMAGFDPLQLPEQQQPPPGGYGWPPMPDSARLPPGNLEDGRYAAGGSGAGGTPGGGYSSGWSEQAGPAMAVHSGRNTPPVQLSAAQRFRQARANQVVPIPEEYLGSRNMPVQE
jgi:hypothetical protein